jgi:hypothetical protein
MALASKGSTGWATDRRVLFATRLLACSAWHNKQVLSMERVSN